MMTMTVLVVVIVALATRAVAIRIGAVLREAHNGLKHQEAVAPARGWGRCILRP